MDYEIIATVGPASQDAGAWIGMLDSGASALRLNTSHLELDELYAWLERLMPFMDSREARPGLILDLQGGKWRLGHFEARVLVPGTELELICEDCTKRADALPVPHTDFFKAALHSSGEIVLDDARICLAIVSIGEQHVRVRVVKGGKIVARKGITYTASSYRLEDLSPKDHAIYEQTQHIAGIRYALSYVRDGHEMVRLRELCGPSAYLIAKLERGNALEDAQAIAQAADELWLCRGDLGAELGSCAMAKAVLDFSNRVTEFTTPVMLAGQVLEHMTHHPHPTRSEVCYLYEALTKGYRGIVLSDETAIGTNPIEACRAAAQFFAVGAAGV